MIALDSREHFLRRPLLRIDQPRGFGERRLVLLQVAFGRGEQVVERHVDHFVGGQLLPVRVLPERELTGGALQQIRSAATSCSRRARRSRRRSPLLNSASSALSVTFVNASGTAVWKNSRLPSS